MWFSIAPQKGLNIVENFLNCEIKIAERDMLYPSCFSQYTNNLVFFFFFFFTPLCLILTLNKWFLMMWVSSTVNSIVTEYPTLQLLFFQLSTAFRSLIHVVEFQQLSPNPCINHGHPFPLHQVAQAKCMLPTPWKMMVSQRAQLTFEENWTCSNLITSLFAPSSGIAWCSFKCFSYSEEDADVWEYSYPLLLKLMRHE